MATFALKIHFRTIVSNLKWIWCLVIVAAGYEIFQQYRIAERQPSNADWQAAAHAIAAEKQAKDLVVIAPDWAIQGRLFLGTLISEDQLGRFDTSRYDRLFEVSLLSARAPETRGLIAESETQFGALIVRRYRLGARASVRYDFLDQVDTAISQSRVPLDPQYVIDVNFQPRRVIPIPVRPGGRAVEFRDVPLSGVLFGYAVIDWHRARYNRTQPLTLTIKISSPTHGQRQTNPLEIHNLSRPLAFEVPLDDLGVGAVTFELLARDGYDRRFGFAADIRTKAPRTTSENERVRLQLRPINE